jgi:isopentenyl diphosphate isomerase/L-lactate dehydrogenase-like FMN-dependent dehydrogenase
VTPYDELVNILEFEPEAERVLAADVFRGVSGSDRPPFERITFRPRLMVNCVDLDLTTEVAGQKLVAPLIVAPIADQRQFHAEGELATIRGASAAKAAVVVSARSSMPIESLAKQATTPLFYQVFAADDTARNTSRAQAAVQAGCAAVVVTIGSTERGVRPPGRADWQAVEAMRRAATVPVVVKGVMTADDARTATKTGAQAIVVSSYGAPGAPGRPAPLDVLADVVDTVEGRAEVLVDGGFRRGTDIMKALALGARAVLVGRPVMWGLAAYGADGVQAVVEMLQTELGRVMGCCGTPNPAAITRAHLKVHAPAVPGRTDAVL